MTIKRFEELDGWQQARTLASLIYEISDKPRLKQERRLYNQITGAALSVMNNIAEGFGNQSNQEFRRYLRYARGSISEVQSCLYLALDRRFILRTEFERIYAQAETTRKLIDGLLRYLRTQKKPRVGKGTTVIDTTDRQFESK